MIQWKPGVTRPALVLRAELLAGIRRFFSERAVLEVETPILSAGATTDPAIASLSSCYRGAPYSAGQTLYLHASPELAMKRLLCAGSGSIYQICKVFRDGERGRLHNPEFTLLEWYRPGFDLETLMQEVSSLVTDIAGIFGKSLEVRYTTYRQLFIDQLGIDPFELSSEQLAAQADKRGIDVDNRSQLVADDWLQLLLTHVIEPEMTPQTLLFVYDYPASQASLARLRNDQPEVAARFEAYLGGAELANGFHELADSSEQRRRFESDNANRRALGMPEVPLDERFLAALSDGGLPDCSGVALGIDRLMMYLAAATDIREVIAFPVEQA